MPRATPNYSIRENECYLGGNLLTLVIHGPPKPQERPRVVRRERSSPRKKNKKNNHTATPPQQPSVHVYNPSTTAQDLFKTAVRRALEPVVDGPGCSFPIFGRHPIEMSIMLYFKRPLTHYHSSTRDPDRLRDEYRSHKPFVVGDIDNHLKFVLDALQGIVYHNDWQVVEVTMSKKYCNDGDARTEILCSAGGYDPMNDVIEL